MTITTAELARIRSAAIGDMLGDPGALDEMGSAATIFRLCRELELSRKHAVTMSEVDRKSTRLNSSHRQQSRMPSSA